MLELRVDCYTKLLEGSALLYNIVKGRLPTYNNILYQQDTQNLVMI